MNWISYKWRNADPALGRFFGSDPIAEDYYYQTNYQFASNSPIWKIEVEGLEGQKTNDGTDLNDDSFLKGWNREVSKFNRSFHNGIDNFLNDPLGATGNFLDNTMMGLGQLAHDLVPGLGEIDGYGNATGEAMIQAGETVMDIPNMSNEELGTTAAAVSLFALEYTITKKTPLPETKVTSRAARRQAMRDEGIPTSQQPISQSKNAAGREYTFVVSKSGGGSRIKSVQQQTKDRNHSRAHWEAAAVKMDNTRVRMNRFKRPKLVNQKSKVEYDD